MITARWWSFSAPATISEALAEPPLITTASGLPLGEIARGRVVALAVARVAAAGRDDLARIRGRRRRPRSPGSAARPGCCAGRSRSPSPCRCRRPPRPAASSCSSSSGKVCSLKVVRRSTTTPSSSRERTGEIVMVSRVIFTSNGSGVPSRVRVMVMSEPTGPRIRSTASFSVSPITLSPSTCGDEVAGLDPGAVGRRALDRRHHLDEAVLLGDLDAEPAELALGLHPHVVEVLRAAGSSNAGRGA